MKQQCHLSMIWLSWLLYLGGLAWFVWHHQWIAAVFWLFVAPLAQWFYIRRFPRISAAVGYGSVADHPAPRCRRRRFRSRSTPRSAALSAR